MSPAAFERLLDALVAAGARNPCVRLETRDGALVFEGARGRARPDAPAPMTPETPFHTASVTKTMTATLILRLVEAGAADLDASLGAIGLTLDGALDRISRRGGRNLGPTITLRQLLTHTGGLRDAFEDDAERLGSAPGSLGAALMSSTDLGRRRWPTWDPAQPEVAEAGILNWYLARGLGKTPVGAPGERFHYSDTGYVLLGLAAERLGGAPLHALFRERLFEPLGLTRTYLAYRDDPPGLGPAREPETEVWSGDRPLLSEGMDLGFDWAGGGLVSTASELIAFLRGLLSGALFRRRETLAAMTRFVAPPGLEPPKTGVGLGLDRTEVEGLELVGRTGFWGARMGTHPASGLFLAGSINQAAGPGDWHLAFFREALAQS